MKRTILALAIAGLSVAAYAAPPPGGGPPTPIAVTVTNSVVPVEVSNSDPIPVATAPSPTLKSDLFVFYSEEGVAVDNEAKVLSRSITQAVDLKAISASAEMMSDTGGCIIKFDVIPASGSPLPLYRVLSLSTVPSSGYLVLPDLRLDPGDTIRVEVASGGACGAVFSAIGVIVR